MPDTNPKPVDLDAIERQAELTLRGLTDVHNLIAELRDLRAALVELAPTRAATPGPDSSDVEQIIADVVVPQFIGNYEMPPARLGERIGELAAAALRAAGLLPGPDTITVNREDLQTYVYGLVGWGAAQERLRAALSDVPEQQP
jgi:hypothetical protein